MRRALLVSALVASAALAGCLDAGGPGGDHTDPLPDPCEFPEIDNLTSLVGGAFALNRQPIEGVEVRATPQDRALDEVVNVTNESGCYILSLDPAVIYDVTWAHDAYGTERQDAVRVDEGEKRIQHVYLAAR